MNRTEQAPEPTMEEILASIRLIISDDAKKAPAERDERPRRSVPPRPEPASLSTLPEEDVLDLTDALVFPEEKPAASAAASSANSRPAKPAALSQEQPVESSPAEPEDAVAAEPETPETADTPQQVELPQPPAEPREDFSRQAPSASRPLWSRRELPGAPTPVAPAPRYEAAAHARQPQRNWAEDIQMPIPERGPVSLIPSQAPVQGQESRDEAEAVEQAETESESGLPSGLGEKEEAAVAALAENLARSAAEAMNSEELTTAGDVDFSRLGHEQKAEVTETFANAIHRESGARDENPLPSLLDEVFRKDFLRDAPAEEEPAEEFEESAASASAKEDDKKASERAFPHWGAPEFALQSVPSRQPEPWTRSEPPSRTTEAVAQSKPALTNVSREADIARPAASGLTFEDTVRDMLRPLMMQWLNEHMPRILENAIREEIGTRGLSPKTEK